MKSTVLLLLMAASAASVSAQTPAPADTTAKPAATAAKTTTKPAAKPATTAAKPAGTAATAAKKTIPAAKAGAEVITLPPGVPPVKAAVKSAFTLRYQDISIGTGAEAAPNKLYKVQYTGWLAADGR